MGTLSFTYKASPAHVIFGCGKVKTLEEEMARRNLTAPLIITTPKHAFYGDTVTKHAGIFSKATMHTPIFVTEEALQYAASVKPDVLVSIGGGSTIGLGKALAVRTGLPHICVPTTYAGSEMTPILGELADGVKTTRSDPKILPNVVIYDPDLTLTLPTGLSTTSGINAIAHAVEALYAENSNPVTSLLALDGIKALAASLPTIVGSPSDISSRSTALYGAWLCSTCLGSVGMALHHKLCHTLGGSFNLPHAEVHTIILPHALAYNSPEIPEQMEKLAQVFPHSNGNAVRGLNALLSSLNAPRSLKDFGFNEEDIDKAADIAVRNPYYNPRSIEKSLIRKLIRRAYAGEEARADL